MGSIQIEILQFWDMADVMRGWQREPEWERRLAGSNWKKMGEFGDSALSRIRASARGGEWIEAVEQGNFAVMVSILEEFECARPREVAHAVDLQRKDRAFLDKRIALGRERFGSA